MDSHASEWPALEAFEGLLDTLIGLQVIDVVVAGMRALPRASAITHHRKTLVSLAIHTEKEEYNQHAYSDEDFGAICTQCTELRQLSVLFPEATLNWVDRHLGTKFSTFLVRSSLLWSTHIA